MKHAILIPLICIYSYYANSQSKNDFVIGVFKGQKEYIINDIQQKQQSKYLALLHFTNLLHSKVADEIQKLTLSFPASGQTINILEGLTGATNINGIIWQSDSVYYSYTSGADKKLTVAQVSFTQLNDTIKTIITHFNDWSYTTFTTNGQALAGPTDHPFYIASKFNYGIAPPVQTIGFYYLVQ